ncbi:DinB family protein [Alkalihalobacillus sp. FSL R5-0424]
MKMLFNYNWQVREEWFEWCDQIPRHLLKEELGGGAGSILYTLFHIVEVEHSWIRGIQGKEDIVYVYEDYASLEKVISLSEQLRKENEKWLDASFERQLEKRINVPWETETYTVNEIIHHIVVHEIHHIGQLSVWARQLGFTPVPAHVVGRML